MDCYRIANVLAIIHTQGHKKHDLGRVVGASLWFSHLCFVSVVFAKLYFLYHNTHNTFKSF